MNDKLYITIGYAVVWCMKYIFMPIGVAVSAIVIAHKLLRPQPERQRKKRSQKIRVLKLTVIHNLTATSVAVLTYIITQTMMM